MDCNAAGAVIGSVRVVQVDEGSVIGSVRVVPSDEKFVVVATGWIGLSIAFALLSLPKSMATQTIPPQKSNFKTLITTLLRNFR